MARFGVVTHAAAQSEPLDGVGTSIRRDLVLLDPRMPITRPDGTRPDTNKGGGFRKIEKAATIRPKFVFIGESR